MIKNFLSIYTNLPYPQYIDIKLIHLDRYYQSLLNYKGCIIHNDFGAGTNHEINLLHEGEVLISEKAKMSLKDNQLSFLVFLTDYLVNLSYFKNKIINVLDVGTGFGLSSLCFSSVSENIEVVSLEGCPNLAKFTRKFQKDNFNIPNLPNIIQGKFTESLLILKSKFDIVFIDGHNVPAYFEEYFDYIIENLLSDNGIIIARNIHWIKKGKKDEKTLFDSWKILEEKYKQKCNFFDLADFTQTGVKFGIAEKI